MAERYTPCPVCKGAATHSAACSVPVLGPPVDPCPECGRRALQCTCAHRARRRPVNGLHACTGCGLELDGDDPNDRCEDCPSSEGHPCGHAETIAGCGGCDPGAIEFVCDDGGPWIRVLPPTEPGGDQ